MGITTKIVKTVTCDRCGNECEEGENFIDFPINGGDGRDVGPTRIRGSITLYQPYGCSGGILCRSCLRALLRRFLGVKAGD